MGKLSSKEDLVLLTAAMPTTTVCLGLAMAAHDSASKQYCCCPQLTSGNLHIPSQAPAQGGLFVFSKRRVLERSLNSSETSNVFNSMSFTDFSYFLQEDHLEILISPCRWKQNSSTTLHRWKHWIHKQTFTLSYCIIHSFASLSNSYF